MSQTLDLYRLQQVDSRLDQINARLQTIADALEKDAALLAAQQALANAQSALSQAEAAVNDLTQQAQTQRTKMEQAEASLYSGRVQSPKELQDLQQDVALLKKHLAALEDQELNAMLTVEQAQAQAAQCQADANREQARVITQNSHLAGERDGLLREAEQRRAERASITPALDAGSMEKYEALRKQKRGVAVARISDDGCGACGSNLPPAVRQSAKSAPTTCPTCGRILFNAE